MTADRPPRWMRAVAALGALAALALLVGYTLASVPASTDPTPKLIDIPAGMRFQEITQLLEREGLIREARVFALLAFVSGATTRIQAGRYELNGTMRPKEILRRLLKGEMVEYGITFPEGATMRQIAAALEERRIVTAEAFLRKATDQAFLASLGIEAASAEGYLFPDTYRFRGAPEPGEIIATMAARLHEVFTPELAERGEELGLDERAVLTLASIVEREAAVAQERPLIAAVFLNRLRRQMRLQADPTVLYGTPRPEGPVRKTDLGASTPYNTYQIEGLPPGPIANPGRAAIMAVVHPARVNYLYFVSRNDGTHHFSATLEEHNNAVARFQRAAPTRN
ncbi:MAG: endolytic transglycosylase MltG [Deltaproteobacteria bacterium]|nr:endolytic transglycosylase MltG [Deltaproteobacteria bacterium]